MATKDELLAQLRIAEEAIHTSIQMVEGTTPGDSVEVNPGDNLMQMVADHPEGTVFNLANDFAQGVGEWEIPKPCTLQSEGGARLMEAFIFAAPDVAFSRLNIQGEGRTIITSGPRTRISACNLEGHPNSQHRGVLVNCEGVRIIDTRILNIFKDIDTQAIAGWDGTKDLRVSNCLLEASGENIMFGGSNSSSPDMMPCYIVIENCKMTKKLEWRADSRASCKNLLELKSCHDVVIRGCEMDTSFVDGQDGYGMVLTVRNDEGGSPWSTIENVLIEDCVLRNLAAGLQVLGRDYIHPSGIMNNVQLRNVRFENIDPATYGNNGRGILLSGGPHNLTLDGLYFDGQYFNSAISCDQPENLSENLIIQNCEFVEGEYGIKSDQGMGKSVLEMYAPGYMWLGNKVHKSGYRYIEWPEGTIFV